MAADTFSRAVAATLKWEGGYVDDAADPGGRTNYGISQRQYPGLDIKNLTKAEAIAIYKRDYWDKFGLDRLPATIAAKVFDLGVNMGPETAIKLLQTAINNFNGSVPLFVGGILGPLTLNLARQVPEVALLAELRGEARAHYLRIIANNPAMAKFQRGWLARAAA